MQHLNTVHKNSISLLGISYKDIEHMAVSKELHTFLIYKNAFLCYKLNMVSCTQFK